MKSTKFFVLSIFLLVMALVFSIPANADLNLIGSATYNSSVYNLIYDTDYQITWLDYSNPKTDWDTQLQWALGLTNAGVLTYNLNPGVTVTWDGDWQLPTALNQNGTGPCSGNNCSDSEIGHLFFTELNNNAVTLGCVQGINCGLVNTGDFQNLASDYYWTSTESSDTVAWYFRTNIGDQFGVGKDNGSFGIAVRPGLAVVPEPISSTLFIVGGATLGFRRFRKKFKK